MLYSIVEFITQVASNSAFIFCFCNLIIVIILMDLKPSLSFGTESEIPVSMANNPGTNHKQRTNLKSLVDNNTRLSEAEEASQAQEAAAVYKIETEGSDKSSNVAEEDEEEEEDELRRKVEEFIEKINKGWKAELLSTSNPLEVRTSTEILTQLNH